MVNNQARAMPKLWIGLDFHKKTWRVHFRTEETSCYPFSMEPLPDNLYSKVKKEYSGYSVEIVYECGCFGYWAHRKFESYDWKSFVVNPSDIPRINKEKYEKTDSIDARKLSKYLKAGLLRSVSIPSLQREHLRSLFRRRVQLVKNIKKLKSILKAQLLYFGVKIPEKLDNSSWTKEFRDWIKALNWEYQTSKQMVMSNITQIEFLHNEINAVGTGLRQYCEGNYNKDYNLLKSVPGIGPLTAICFISEVGDIRRFNNFKQLACLIGMMPSTYQSANTNITKGLTPRALRIMRSYLIEASWQAIRIDPVMREYYKSHEGKKPNDRIVKVARKLLSRIYGILRTGNAYEIGLVK